MDIRSVICEVIPKKNKKKKTYGVVFEPIICREWTFEKKKKLWSSLRT